MLVTEPLALPAPRGTPSAHAPSTSQSAASSSSRRDFARASCAVQHNRALSSQGHGAASALLGRNADRPAVLRCAASVPRASTRGAARPPPLPRSNTCNVGSRHISCMQCSVAFLIKPHSHVGVANLCNLMWRPAAGEVRLPREQHPMRHRQ